MLQPIFTIIVNKERKPQNRREQILNTVTVEKLDDTKIMTEIKRKLTNLDEIERINVKTAMSYPQANG